jgi:hypothetical protein
MVAARVSNSIGLASNSSHPVAMASQVEGGASRREAAEEFEISASTAIIWVKCFRETGRCTGHQRRLPINLRSRTTEFPPTSGNQRPCRDAGVGAIAPAFAMLERAKRASHIDPPASSYAIMQRAGPYCGENPGPGKDC